MANSKGQDWEREESRFLSLWWTSNKRDDIFWRNRVKVTTKTPNAESQMGDLTAQNSIGLPFIEMFNIELKAGYSHSTTKQKAAEHKKRNEKRIKEGKEPLPMSVRNVPWDLLDVIDGKSIDDNLKILQFWGQCERDASITHRIPLLIFKRDFHLPVVCIEAGSMGLIKEYQGELLVRRILLCDHNNTKILCLYRHSDFFEWLKPEIIKLIHNQRCKDGEMGWNFHRKEIRCFSSYKRRY